VDEHRVTIPAGHPAFTGHFPGAPILPAVLLLDEMLRSLEAGRARELNAWRIGAAKFLKPVRPGETLSFAHERLPSGSIRFSVSSAGKAVAHALIVPERVAAEPPDDGAAG
jgi:3-hydroxymyristoyl/3-hydroxydecanoyl-(acyl carrier protein) dehydratase